MRLKMRVGTTLHFIIFLICLGALIPLGLYFPAHSYYFILVVSIIASVLWLYELVRGKKPYIPLFLLPIPFLYLLPYFTNRESAQGTLDQLIVFAAYVAFYFLLTKAKPKIHLVILALSWSMVVLSLAIMGGIISFPNFILSVSTDVSGLGERISGFTQYPNAFATLVGGMLLYHLIFSMKEKAVKKFYVHSFLLPAFFGMFLLTESRGAWLCFVITWVISIWVIDKNQQLRYFALTAYTGLSGLILYIVMTLKGEIHFSILALVIWMIVTLGVVVFQSDSKLTRLLVSWHEKFPKKLNTPYFLPILLLFLIVMTGLDIYFKGLFFQQLPEALQGRLSFGTGTFEDRLYYWKDAWSYLSSFALTGLGGDGWASLMYRAQSFPYLTRELHNGYLDIFVELGIVGLLYIVGLIIWTGKRLWETKSFVFPVFLFILLHGVIDFSFSYPAIIMWMFLLIGSENLQTDKNRNLETRWPSQVIFALLILVCGFLSIKFIKAENDYKAAESSATREEASTYIIDAINQNKWNPEYLLFALDNELVSASESDTLLKQALNYEPNNSLLQIYLADLYVEHGKNKEAESLYEQALVNDPFDVKKYEKVSAYYLNRAEQFERSGDGAKARIYRTKAEKLIMRVGNLVVDIQHDRLQNQRNFYMSEELLRIKELVNK